MMLTTTTTENLMRALVRGRMDQLSLSVSDVARQAGLWRSELSAYLCGRRGLAQAKRRRLADLLELGELLDNNTAATADQPAHRHRRRVRPAGDDCGCC